MRWNTRTLKGFWQLVMDQVPFSTFLRMRATCSLFYEISPALVRHWYHWLVLNGERHWTSDGHAEDVRCFTYKCKKPQHQRNLRWEPVVRVTRPLHLQVFQQILRRRVKSRKRRSITLFAEKERLEQALTMTRREFLKVSASLDDCTTQLERVDEQLKKHSVRLTISNFK